MKLTTLLLGIGFTVIGSMSTTSFAQTTVPSGCSWVTTSVQSGPTGAIVNFACQLNGTAIATREQKYNNHSPSCSITWVAPGYTASGPCESAQILKYVTTAANAANICYSGESMIVQTGPNGYMNPVFNANHFCGQGCGYTVQPLDNHSYPRLKYTCK